MVSGSGMRGMQLISNAYIPWHLFMGLNGEGIQPRVRPWVAHELRGKVVRPVLIMTVSVPERKRRSSPMGMIFRDIPVNTRLWSGHHVED